ncbi:hypothetical protein MN086_05225 [Sulfurovum sp. XGS-02]|uniref:hypothetical protein n=1 Tax=Sulfurovum sp. XGS-02 TaxID=2925411 RepID=UPI00206F53B0|nr:hypothetical protein [Sulfurovum sp. XGS-02]UPT78551.1 hypothetical protein MN086_05225 [Sulfurovum sp. XGS-02]
MKIMKYVLLALLLLALWITEPLWMKKHTDISSSPIDMQISEQNHQKAKQLASEAAKLNELEIKFGPKPYGKYSTGVPSEVYAYWDKTLRYPESLEEERCGPIQAGESGWTTVCRYRAKNSARSLQLMQDTFIIKNGKATK